MKDFDGYYTFESKMNIGVKDIFETAESIATFHNKTFIEQIKDNLKFYEMSVEALSKSCNISLFRLNALINSNATFEIDEVNLIKRRLHI